MMESPQEDTEQTSLSQITLQLQLESGTTIPKAL